MTPAHNLGKGIVYRFTKLGKIRFSMEFYTTNFPRSSTNIRTCFSVVIKSKHFKSFFFFFSCVGTEAPPVSGDNNPVPFHLWWREKVQKHEKVDKYFVQDYRCFSVNFAKFLRTPFHRISAGDYFRTLGTNQ